MNSVMAWRDGEKEPEVWLEDLRSSNGTFVSGRSPSSLRKVKLVLVRVLIRVLYWCSAPIA
jgi:hypothetical protein